jgi:hypothetical protein
MSFHAVDGQRIIVVQMPNFQLVLQEQTDGQQTANRGLGRHGVLHIHRLGAAKVLVTARLEPLC